MTTRRVSQSSSAQPKIIRPISPGAQPGTVMPSLRRPRERILLSGDTVSGKTYAYLRMAWKALQKAVATNTIAPRFFVLDTDDKISKYMPTAWELLDQGKDLQDPQIQDQLWGLLESGSNDFSALYCGAGGNLYPYPVSSWYDTSAAAGTIMKEAGREDWIVVDVVNRIYEQAQEFWAATGQTTVADKIVKARIAAPKSAEANFGGFDPGDWNTVARIHNSIITPMYFNSQANLLFLSHIRPVVENRGTREGLVLFDAIGMEPNCATGLKSLMDTIIILWSRWKISKDDRGQRVGKSYVERFMTIPKDHGQAYMTTHGLDQDFWVSFLEARKFRDYPENIKPGTALESLNGLEDFKNSLGESTGDNPDELILMDNQAGSLGYEIATKEAIQTQQTHPNSVRPKIIIRKELPK